MIRWPRAFRLAAFLTLQSILLLIALEIALRFLKPHHRGLRALLYRSATATNYSNAQSLEALMNRSMAGFTPHETRHGFVLNRRSFRTREYSQEKPPDIYRIVALGDSFTYGPVPDADHWTSLLEKDLSQANGRDVEVLRLGVPGTGVPFYLRLWQLEGALLDPDLVILGLFVGNDFFDELGMAPGWQGLEEKLVNLSYTYRVARNLLRLRRDLEKSGPFPARNSKASPESSTRGGYEIEGYRESFDESRPTFSSKAYAQIEAKRMSICLKDQRLKFDVRFDRVVRLVERMHWEIEQVGARFLVLIIPDEFQIDETVRRQALQFAGRREEDYVIDLPQKRLKSFFKRRGVEYLDLFPLFQETAQEGERLYLIRDSHWNRAGNRLAASALLYHVTKAR